MSIGNTRFYPSIVEDRIYDLMEHFLVGSDTYDERLLIAISDMLAEDFPHVDWQAHADTWQNEEGACVSFAWVENGHLHLIGWDEKFGDPETRNQDYYEYAGYLTAHDFWRAIKEDMNL